MEVHELQFAKKIRSIDLNAAPDLAVRVSCQKSKRQKKN